MDKKALTETDIRTKCISPAIVSAGWDIHSQVYEEFSNTDGCVGAKVDRLFALCGQQKDQLQQAGDTERHLTNAIVEQALS
ncbi:hypothetical protein GCM10011297_05750 [Bacterioplanes sanyensis]|uniref:hypothetical protein n=1 Tax=Bacterioplanes sanyensis TaxID=1249553 RepID=UPI001676A391|nr:hypothetical protein [Bacterioplanes sanyensis]GGY35463.1 hypothetical protein GCM10011297_05750 [Bacterioplanes sanyensis]